MVNSIKVPFGLDEAGNEVPASEASHGERYVCPDCRGVLTPKLGPVRVKHFAHRIDPIICDFRHETEEHYRAKMAIAQAVNDGRDVKLLRECPWCLTPKPYALPPEVRQATVEHLLSTKHRADVALLDEHGAVLAAIEVLMHHEVDEEKASALAEHGLPWVELAATDVLAASVPVWPLTRDHLPSPDVCESCTRTRALAWEAIQRAIDQGLGITLVRTCPGCRQPWPQPLPEKVSRAVPDFSLEGDRGVSALIDVGNNAVALFELEIAGQVPNGAVAGMRSSGLPWAVFPAEAMTGVSEATAWPVVMDGLKGKACRSCRTRRWQEQEAERQLRHQQWLIETYRATHPYLGPRRLQVLCPAPGVGSVSTIGACAVCPYLLDAEENGIICYGGAWCGEASGPED